MSGQPVSQTCKLWHAWLFDVPCFVVFLRVLRSWWVVCQGPAINQRLRHELLVHTATGGLFAAVLCLGASCHRRVPRRVVVSFNDTLSGYVCWPACQHLQSISSFPVSVLFRHLRLTPVRHGFIVAYQSMVAARVYGLCLAFLSVCCVVSAGAGVSLRIFLHPKSAGLRYVVCAASGSFDPLHTRLVPALAPRLCC